MKRMLFALLMAVVVVLGFSFGIARLEKDRLAEDRQLLTDTLHRTAAACYTSEGFYPPDVAYMRQHYGLTYDEDRFTVEYDRFASNLMPDITVLEKTYEK